MVLAQINGWANLEAERFSERPCVSSQIFVLTQMCHLGLNVSVTISSPSCHPVWGANQMGDQPPAVDGRAADQWEPSVSSLPKHVHTAARPGLQH